MDIVGQVLANKMSKSDPEYKNFKESYDKVVPYFTDRFSYIADELVFEVFQEINDRQHEIVNVLQKNMLDLCDFIRFFAKCFKKVNPVTVVVPGRESVDSERHHDSHAGGRNIF